MNYLFLLLLCSWVLQDAAALRLGLSSAVRVWDAVLKDASPIAATLEQMGSCHYLFNRAAMTPQSARNSIEAMLHGLLSDLGDTSPYVECWCRDDWMNLDAHRDVDEFLARRQDESFELRCPIHAHVLYLDVGARVQGPTCLFLEGNGSSSGLVKPETRIQQLVAVPARSGRLLRFPGDVVHAVPRPALCYLDPEEGGSNLEMHMRVRNEIEHFPDLRRSVLLFNTWAEPPIDVDAFKPSLQGSSSGSSSGVYLTRLRDWREVPVQALEEIVSAEQPSVRLKVGVLGDRRRRFASEAFVNLYTHRGIKVALQSPEAVHCVAIHHNAV